MPRIPIPVLIKFWQVVFYLALVTLLVFWLIWMRSQYFTFTEFIYFEGAVAMFFGAAWQRKYHWKAERGRLQDWFGIYDRWRFGHFREWRDIQRKRNKWRFQTNQTDPNYEDRVKLARRYDLIDLD